MTRKFIYTVITVPIVMLLFSCLPGCRNKTVQEGQVAAPDKKAFLESRFEAFAERLASLPETERDTALERFMASFPHTPVYERDSIVSLYWYGNADRILINGDLQHGWSEPDTLQPISCGENTFFHITYTVPPDSRLDYQFVVDTMTTTDPRNPVITPSGYGPHSEIAMPGFVPDTVRQFRPDIPHGSIDSMLFSSKHASILPRQVRVYLPAGYDTLAGLPVLFVLDGLEAMEYMDYPVVLDNMIADRRIGPVLVVFIPPAERHVEYILGKQDAFMNAVCHEFVPLIDRTYRTDPRPEKRGIAGISSGGHLALLMVLSHPDVFLCGAGQSPSLTHHIENALRSLLKDEVPRQDFRIYLDVGRYDLASGSINNQSFLKATENLHIGLQEAGIGHAYQAVNDGHEWANWRERTDEVLEYFWK